MQLFVLSLNHRTHRALLPQLLHADALVQIASGAASSVDLAESVLVSTCLRLELYGVARDPEAIRGWWRALLERVTGIDARTIEPELEVEEGAARHLLRVTAGLDSVLWGETSVTGQVRAAYRAAIDRSLVGPLLHRLFHQAFRTARRLRSEGLVTPAVGSWSELALRSARIHGGGSRLLVVGAGKAGQAILREARRFGFDQLLLHGSRNDDLQPLADSAGARVASSLGDALSAVDVVITCSSRGALVRRAHWPEEPPRLAIDLGMPANLVRAELPAGVRLLDLTELEAEARRLAETRPRPADSTPVWETILTEGVETFIAWRRGLDRSAAAKGRGNGSGRVSFVGAGPGDPELLTVRAARLLREADVVFHDALLPPDLLAAIPAGVRRVPVGRVLGQVISEARATERSLIEWARAGARVVRLKGGDPALFARLGEETEALRAAGIAYEVVPGVTAALAAAASAGASLTARELAASCAFVTFRTRAEADGEAHRDRLLALAASADTLAIYMGSRHLEELGELLLAAGRSPQTPVLLVSRATHPDEQIVPTSIARLGEIAHALATPAIVLIGPSLSHCADPFLIRNPIDSARVAP